MSLHVAEENPTLEQILAEPKKWRNLLYERKVLVLRDLHLDADQFYAVHKAIGKPWTADMYMMSHELPFTTERGSVVTRYSNVLMAKSLGNGSIGWHRDIPFHHDHRYPIRSLYPIILPSAPTSTMFMDANHAFTVMTERERATSMRMRMEIQSWYDVVFDHETVKRKEIPMVEQHPHTRKFSLLLNATGERGWVQDTLLDGRRLGPEVVSDLITRAAAPENVYEHFWKLGDLVLFDNWSGVMHSRRELTTGAEERAFWRINARHYWQK